MDKFCEIISSQPTYKHIQTLGIIGLPFVKRQWNSRLLRTPCWALAVSESLFAFDASHPAARWWRPPGSRGLSTSETLVHLPWEAGRIVFLCIDGFHGRCKAHHFWGLLPDSSRWDELGCQRVTQSNSHHFWNRLANPACDCICPCR